MKREKTSKELLKLDKTSMKQITGGKWITIVVGGKKILIKV